MESVEQKGNKEGNRRRYCVTGANGYFGSYLVKHLLQSGASVHATLRNPPHNSVQRHLLPFWESSSGSSNNNRLHLFKADLQEPGSFDEALNGCDGVFHVAASMQFHIPSDPLRRYEHHSPGNRRNTQSAQILLEIIREKGRLHIFSQHPAGKNPNGSWKRVVDETSQAGVDQTRRNRASGWVCALSKLLTEEAAFKYCKENGIVLISVVTFTVAGPFFTETVPSNIRVLLCPVTGDSSYLSILSAVSERMSSIGLVHSEDVRSAHLFLMEHPRAQGRYLCCSGSCLLPELVDLLIEERHNTCSNCSEE